MDPQPQPRRWSPLCTVSHGGQQYLCHSSSLSTQSDGGMQIHVTDGIEVWRAELTEEILEEWKITNSGLSPSQDSSEKLRETFQRNAPLLEVQGSLASLTIPLDSGNVTIDLFKVPISEARSHLQAVMFDLADRVRNLEKLLRAAEGTASASVSPVKPTQRNQFLLIPDVEARKQGRGTSASQLKKRVPGESLINPGCRRKKAAKGVDFEEV
ncbi:protein PAXX isoform X2 [Ascaphus truei]|uniref:protein PAXX isoform X2 n=1 Tax=Ascaphus truei TaxID=8439 RepID=UPI003F5AA0E2